MSTSRSTCASPCASPCISMSTSMFAGYPEHMLYNDFYGRYCVLSNEVSAVSQTKTDDKEVRIEDQYMYIYMCVCVCVCMCVYVCVWYSLVHSYVNHSTSSTNFFIYFTTTKI